MKLEKLKSSSRKKVILGLTILLAITSSLILSISLAKFKKTESIPLAKGTINYSGADFSMVAIKLSDDKETYTGSETIPIKGYTFNSEKSACKVGDVKQDIEIVYDEGKMNFIGMTKKNTKCNLYFDKILGGTSSDIIANIYVTEQTDVLPNFASAATTNEGVFKTSDGMYGGDTYYWRGAVDNNHVIFANMCWKIIRINGDGSIRLIYNGTPSGLEDNRACKQISDATSIAVEKQFYNYSNMNYYVGWTYEAEKQRPTDNNTATPSNIMIQTNTWYENNIMKKGFDEKVATGKFCNDRSTALGSSWQESPGTSAYYAAWVRSGAYNASTVTPVTTCPEGDVYEMKVGAITADEVIMAGSGKIGATWGTENSAYYLYNAQNYWTMTPYGYYFGSNGGVNVFRVGSNGILTFGEFSNSTTGDSDVGIRPIINLLPSTIFKSGGNGTSSTPYIVE